MDFPGIDIIRKISGNGRKLILSGDPGVARSAFPEAELASELDQIMLAVGG